MQQDSQFVYFERLWLAHGRRGALSAVFLGTAYLGFAAPYVTAVTSEATTAVQVPLTVFTVLTLVLCALLTVVTRRGLDW